MGAPPTIEYANLGMADSLILMVLALVVFGPRRLPQIGRQLGKLMYEFRKASNDFKYQMEEELRNAEEADRRKKDEERLRVMTLEAPKPQPAETAETAAAYSNPAESPAAYETAAESNPCAAADSVSESQPAAENAARIQPPSTGERVAAQRPGAAECGAQPSAESEPTYYFSAENEAAPQGSPEVTEQATHNG